MSSISERKPYRYRGRFKVGKNHAGKFDDGVLAPQNRYYPIGRRE